MAQTFALLALLLITCSSAPDELIQLDYAPSPIANPLKGLVPYASNANSNFPHSMEFSYLGFAELMRGYDDFDWTAMEELLTRVSNRGHQTVIRIYLEYPAKKDVIPKFLIDDGLKVHRYLNTNTQPLPPASVETPDYEDINLRRALKNFIAAFGAKYDGDPRIGFITAGLLGTWGEWHTYPKEELFASKKVQAEVMDAYQSAFRVTPILLRYPANDKTWGKASNADRPFGYHDDSFAWATLDTGKKGDDWFYMPALKQAGVSALEKWKKHPIGGEVRPEAWGKVFDKDPSDDRIQNFRKCVEQTHASWLMDSGMFNKKPNKERTARAEEEVRRMGYEFYVSEVNLVQRSNKLHIQMKIQNRGVAPFYYDWKLEYGLIEKGELQKRFVSTGDVTNIPADGAIQIWNDVIDLAELPQSNYTLAIRIPNALPKGQPVRFANATQDRDLDGWMSLTTVAN